MTEVLVITAASILVYMTAWFIAAHIRGRNDIADVAWGLGFILAAAVSLLAGGIYPLRGLLVSGLVLLWGIRLAVHIHSRNRGKVKTSATGNGARSGERGSCCDHSCKSFCCREFCC